MSLRPPSSFTLLQTLANGAEQLEAEIRSEKAAALGRSGEAVKKALDALREASDDERTARAFAAAEAVQGLFIQRELMGLRGHADVVRQLGVPAEVLSKIGARPSSGT